LDLLDAQNRRITVLSGGLHLAREIPLGAGLGQPQKALPEPGGYLLYSIPSDTALVEVTEKGARSGAHPLPWRGITQVHWMARDGYLLKDDASDLIVYAFKYSNGWIAFKPEADTIFSRGRFFFDEPFPRVIRKNERGGYSLYFSQRATPTIRGASISDGCLYVVANDVGGSAQSVVDVFDASSARYLLSYHIPFSVDDVAVSNGVAYALGLNPHPIVVRVELGRTCARESLAGGSQ
jgi:hypothetical protein